LCRLLQVLAKGLGLPAHHFDRYFDRPMIFLRPLHYAPKVSAPEDGIFGAGGVTGLYAWVWEWAVRMGLVWCGVVWCGVVWCRWGHWDVRRWGHWAVRTGAGSMG